MDDHGEVPTVQTCVEPGCHFFGGWGWQRAAGGAIWGCSNQIGFEEFLNAVSWPPTVLAARDCCSP